MTLTECARMLSSLACAGLLACVAVGVVFADDEVSPRDKRLAEQDVRSFVTYEAAHGHLAVVAGQLAAERASSDAVRQFAQQVVNDRIPLTLRLYDKAASSNLEAPQALLDEDQAALSSLEALSGTAFDRAYLELMVDRLSTDIHLADRANPAWRGGWETFAKTIAPTLDQELRQAMALQAALGA